MQMACSSHTASPSPPHMRHSAAVLKHYCAGQQKGQMRSPVSSHSLFPTTLLQDRDARALAHGSQLAGLPKPLLCSCSGCFHFQIYQRNPQANDSASASLLQHPLSALLSCLSNNRGATRKAYTISSLLPGRPGLRPLLHFTDQLPGLISFSYASLRPNGELLTDEQAEAES